ncbi:MAG: helix-turn-helix transcriptional regulator [Acidobacteriia bacterium]|nr:helix-turn-helix transcriptional regulator [Terriglobia bacterium]
MTKSLGQTIREARVAAGMTQRELAAKIKKQDGQPITPQYLNDIEFDRRTPTEFISDQIAKVLGLHAGHLVMMAGSLPAGIVREGISEEKAKEALKAFRKPK